jgi:uncharacterized protein with HEPN domain
MSSKRNPVMALSHIQHELEWAIPAFKGVSLADLNNNTLKLRAAQHAILIISEAVRHLPQDMLDANSSIDWKAIRGAGNFLRHEYDQVDTEVIWRTVSISFPQLAVVINAMIEKVS